MRAVLDDDAVLPGVADGQIGGAFRALRLLNDLLAELIESGWRSSGLKSGLNVGGLDFAARGRGWSRGAGSGEPERCGIQRQESGWRSGGVTKLETQFDSRDLRGRPGQQQIGIADRMKGGGTAERAADFKAAGGLADMMDL